MTILQRKEIEALDIFWSRGCFKHVFIYHIGGKK